MQVTIYTIKGDVEKIQRENGKTEVVVSDGQNNSAGYKLDEPLIEFGFAVEAGELEKAANILDPLDFNQETEANWQTLAKIAQSSENLSVAEHCYAALGALFA